MFALAQQCVLNYPKCCRMKKSHFIIPTYHLLSSIHTPPRIREYTENICRTLRFRVKCIPWF